jgi:hypothetical protein
MLERYNYKHFGERLDSVMTNRRLAGKAPRKVGAAPWIVCRTSSKCRTLAVRGGLESSVKLFARNKERSLVASLCRDDSERQRQNTGAEVIVYEIVAEATKTKAQGKSPWRAIDCWIRSAAQIGERVQAIDH